MCAEQETFVNYFMTNEDKLRKAREIEENTGISADAFMDDECCLQAGTPNQ